MRDLYSQVMTNLINLSPPSYKPPLQQQKDTIMAQFAKIIPAQ